jgi:hypothetical protein
MIVDNSSSLGELPVETQEFYRRAIHLLDGAAIPFLVGGAYSLAEHTGVVRHTKDFDIFVRPDDAPRVLQVLGAAGYRTEETFSHWLGKAWSGDDFVDVIFSSGNGVAKVDNLWFQFAASAHFLGVPVLLCPVEETIWSKSYVVERERFDGADINHLIRACGRRLDWQRLLLRFGGHWRVLLSHLTLYGFVYPSERDAVPAWVMQELIGRLQQESEPGALAERRVCLGTLLSRIQYAIDVNAWGFADGRLDPESGMTPEQVRLWTEAGLREQRLRMEALHSPDLPI